MGIEIEVPAAALISNMSSYVLKVDSDVQIEG
jgi:hypothetical protein